MSQPVKIAIVIVNYRTPDLVADCLASLAEEHGPDHALRVFVGDADSGDGSVAKIKAFIAEKGYGDWALCYDIGTNGGFAFGNNAIVKTHVLPDPSFDYVHFLNPDTYIHPGAVRALADFLAAHPQAGVAGSRLENPDGTPRAYGFRFPALWREFFRGAQLGPLDRLLPSARVKIDGLETNTQVDWVSGASFMVPRAVLDDIGLMDDGYFLYFEETELMLRARRSGFAVWHVASSRVVHLAGAATGVRSDDVEVKRLSPFWLKSRSRFLRARYGRIGVWVGTLLFLAGDLVYRLQCLLRGRRVQNPPHLWRDYIAHGFPGSRAGA